MILIHGRRDGGSPGPDTRRRDRPSAIHRISPGILESPNSLQTGQASDLAVHDSRMGRATRKEGGRQGRAEGGCAQWWGGETTAKAGRRKEEPRRGRT